MIGCNALKILISLLVHEGYYDVMMTINRIYSGY